jgi:hypothetical protein
VYSIATEIPAVYLLFDSETNSTIFLFFIFGVSVWNGGGFYVEVSKESIHDYQLFLTRRSFWYRCLEESLKKNSRRFAKN